MGRIDDLRKRLEREPGSRVFAQLAEELRKDGQLVEAVHACRQGLRQHPGYASARMTLGRALVESGDLASARGEFDKVLEAAPDNILAGRLLAEVLEGLGETAAARERYELTLHLAPDDTQLRSRLEALVKGDVAAAPASPPDVVKPVVETDVPRPRAQSVVAAAMAADARRDTEPPAETIPFQEPSVDPLPAASLGRDAASESGGGDSTGVAEIAGQPDVDEGMAVEGSSGPDESSGSASDRDAAPQSAVGGRAEPDVAAAFAEAGSALQSARGALPTSSTLPEGAPRPRPSGDEAKGKLPTSPFRAEALRTAAERAERPTDAQAKSEMATPTLAELYLTQGHPDRAVDVYVRVLERNPDNRDARERLAEIRAEIEAAAALATIDRPQRVQSAIVRLEAFLSQVQAHVR